MECQYIVLGVFQVKERRTAWNDFICRIHILFDLDYDLRIWLSWARVGQARRHKPKALQEAESERVSARKQHARLHVSIIVRGYWTYAPAGY